MMLLVKMKYSVSATVAGVTERSRAVSSRTIDRGLPTERIETERESLGWYVTIDSGVSFGLGEEKPELEAGDRVKITIERVEP